MDTLETGDIILFRGNSWLSYLLQWIGRSRYSHVGMIIKNPSFINNSLPDGLYLLESGWNSIPDSEDHTIKTGVQLHLLSDILKECQPGSVYVRRISCQRNPTFYEKLDTIHQTIHNRPYDMNLWDWIRAAYHLDIDGSIAPSSSATTKQFWCSALIAYVFDKLDLIEPVNWSVVTPRDFSLWSTRLQFRCTISQEELIK
jgi:hypothetical protein